jgi:hypothetical protein
MQGFRGQLLQCDGYDGYERLTRIERPWTLVHCWSHLRRRFVKLMRNTKSPIAEAAIRQIAALYAVEQTVRGMSPEDRLAARRNLSLPIVDALRPWFEKQLSMISSGSTLATDIRYGLAHWEGLTRFLDDGRLELDTNPVENAIRPVAGPESLCTPSSSVCKHWKRVGIGDATRATFSGRRGLNRCRGQVVSSDLIGRAGNNLLSGQRACLDELAYPMAGHAQGCRGLGHGQPGAVFFCGSVGVDSAYASDGRDTVRRPGFPLSCRQSHSVERCGDMFVRPAPSHASHYGQRILCRCAAMFTGSRLAYPQL